MNFQQIFYYVYLIFAVFFLYDAFEKYQNAQNPLLSLLIAGAAIFMFFFRRNFNKKFRN